MRKRMGLVTEFSNFTPKSLIVEETDKSETKKGAFYK